MSLCKAPRPLDPFTSNAQPNAWTPPSNTTWCRGVDLRNLTRYRRNCRRGAQLYPRAHRFLSYRDVGGGALLGEGFIEVLPSDPDWVCKYALRICLDLHAVSGSQNGLPNAQRTLYYIRVLAEFIVQRSTATSHTDIRNCQ
ncbi:hypothetical protein BDQ12DRAFT_400332 [Crucibulum laeve]|uniref:Uncharacterized protein n=1 Tax=Crucibulum laeve TaxID=68775 RepID=A0A5C3LM96_9AGAR|nr:hypothetical protein BDQ12DRAFT_400332 [Crucibulum laeve]